MLLLLLLRPCCIVSNCSLLHVCVSMQHCVAPLQQQRQRDLRHL
jgi:hypothetical protein